MSNDIEIVNPEHITCEHDERRGIQVCHIIDSKGKRKEEFADWIVNDGVHSVVRDGKTHIDAVYIQDNERSVRQFFTATVEQYGDTRVLKITPEHKRIL